MAKKKQTETDIYERTETGRIIGEKPEHRNKPGHHLGRSPENGGLGHGYTIHPDGSYELSASDLNALRELQAELDAVNGLLNSVWDHAERRSRAIHAAKARWFSEMCRLVYREADEGRASVSFITGRLTFEEDPPVKEQPAPEGGD